MTFRGIEAMLLQLLGVSIISTTLNAPGRASLTIYAVDQDRGFLGDLGGLAAGSTTLAHSSYPY